MKVKNVEIENLLQVDVELADIAVEGIPVLVHQRILNLLGSGDSMAEEPKLIGDFLGDLFHAMGNCHLKFRLKLPVGRRQFTAVGEQCWQGYHQGNQHPQHAQQSGFDLGRYHFFQQCTHFQPPGKPPK